MKDNNYYVKKQKENYKELKNYSTKALMGMREELEAKLYFCENLVSSVRVISIIACIVEVICNIMEHSIPFTVFMECIPYITLFTISLCVMSLIISVFGAFMKTKLQMTLKRVERLLDKKNKN